MHDSQVIGVLVDPDEITLADSAYQNQATPKGAELFTCLKNTRCKSLKADDKMFRAPLKTYEKRYNRLKIS